MLAVYDRVSLWEQENPIEGANHYPRWTVILFVNLYIYIQQINHTFLKFQSALHRIWEFATHFVVI